MKYIDLHIHSNYSDGTYSVEKLLKHARKVGLSAISITDHDTVEGSLQALRIVDDNGDIEVIPGVEFSSYKNRKSVHILGYFIDLHSPKLQSFINHMKVSRHERALKILDKLKRYNIEVPIEIVQQFTRSGLIGRPHIAQAMKFMGYVATEREAFEKYIGNEAPCYVPQEAISPEKVIHVIREIKGIPVLAHPGKLRYDELIPELKKHGLLGLEVYYPTHTDEDIARYKRIAKELDLIVTGGSDSHGDREGYPRLGECRLPYTILEGLRNLWVKLYC